MAGEVKTGGYWVAGESGHRVFFPGVTAKEAATLYVEGGGWMLGTSIDVRAWAGTLDMEEDEIVARHSFTVPIDIIHIVGETQRRTLEAAAALAGQLCNEEGVDVITMMDDIGNRRAETLSALNDYRTGMEKRFRQIVDNADLWLERGDLAAKISQLDALINWWEQQ